MADTFTPNFRLTKTDFNTRGWQDKVNNNFATLDAITGSFLPLSGLKGVWTNFLPILVNDILVDAEFGTLWRALVPHNTPGTGTFLQDRLANPSRWEAYTQPAKARGTWTPGTNYNVNDFVVVSGVSQRYAICLVSHVSSALFDTDLAANKWSVLIDVSLTGLGLGTMATQNANNVNITGGQFGANILVDNPAIITPIDVSNDFLVRAAASGLLSRATMTNVRNILHNVQTYVPTLTNITNIDAASIIADGLVRFMRIGNMVVLWGFISIDCTAAGNAELQATLPIASTLGVGENVGGLIASRGISDGSVGVITGDIATNRLRILINPSFTIANTYTMLAFYRIL